MIEALTILRKYTDSKYPTHCAHDVLMVALDVDVSKVSVEDLSRLEKLGFIAGDPYGDATDAGFFSYRFGSC